jgi:hypothetical protein
MIAEKVVDADVIGITPMTPTIGTALYGKGCAAVPTGAQ